MNLKRSRGYTLLELAISLVVLGLVLVLVWRFGSATSQRIKEVEAPHILAVADQALLGFVAANSRLPCPDSAGLGSEDCGGAATGSLPWVTLGLPRADMTNIRYGVFRNPVAGSVDLAGVAATDSFFPMLAAIPSGAGVAPSALSTALGPANGLDFCDKLRIGAGLPAGAAGTTRAALRIDRPDPAAPAAANGIPLRNVAYALSLPGQRSDPLTNLNTVPNVFSAPGQPVGAGYDDHVLAADFGQLYDRLACAGVLSAAGHSHVNAATSAAILYGSLLDYKVQLDLGVELAKAATLSADAGIAAASAGVANAAGQVATAASLAVSSLGSASALVGLAAAAVATNAAAVVASAVTKVEADKALVTAQERVAQFSGTDAKSLYLLEHAHALAEPVVATPPNLPSTRTNAIAADAAGLY